MKKTFIAFGLACLTSSWAQAECGDISIADMNWSTATFLANVDKLILEEGYGCTVSLVPGDTVPTSTSMIEKGQPDIAPEMWTNSVKEPLDRAVAEGRLAYAGASLSDGGEEGFWVPEYLVEQYPELSTIEGIRKHARLFTHPEDPDKSMFMGCPSGWVCQVSSENLFRALKLEQSGFAIVDPGSGAGLAGAIAKAYERKQPWFGYYWAPTAVMGRYPMVKVDFGSGVNEEHFRSCLTQDDCVSPEVSMFPKGPVWTVTTAKLQTESPEVFEYFSRRSMTNVQMNQLLTWIEDNQADGEYAALHFLQKHPAIWQKWLPSDIAAKVSNAF